MHRIVVSNALAENLWEPSENLQRTFRELDNLQRTFREPSENLQKTFREPSREPSENLSCPFLIAYTKELGNWAVAGWTRAAVNQ